MKPRSIVFDLFGDYVRYAGGEISLQSLVALLGEFGVAPPTTRVVLARLRQEGWFDSRRLGRQSLYSLNSRSWALLDEGRSRIFDRAPLSWDGRWRMVIYVVPETARKARDSARRKLAWRGFGPLAPSTYLSPHDRLAEVDSDLAEEPEVRYELFTCSSMGAGHDAEIARRCWDLEGLARDYAELAASYRHALASWRRRPPGGRDALVKRMELVHRYRLLPFRDPRLPAALLPPRWPGEEAHALFIQAHELLRGPAEEHFSKLSGLELRS